MGVFDAVFASSVRRAVLAELSERPRQRRDLLDDVDASKSAVYNALNELRDRDLLREGRTRRWETTGLGDLVAEYVAARERTGEVLSTHAEYWTTHDATAVPESFRTTLGALAGAERLASPDAEPFRVAGTVVDVIERADRVALATPHDRYAAALERAAREAAVRLVLADVEGREDPNWDADPPAVRVGEPTATVLVTDDALLLSLPREDGTHDPGETLLVDTDRAREWGERLFEHHWRDATPLDALERPAQH